MKIFLFALWLALCGCCLVELVCCFAMLYYKDYLHCCTYGILGLIFYVIAKDSKSIFEK
jgi:hypothetical protein